MDLSARCFELGFVNFNRTIGIILTLGIVGWPIPQTGPSRTSVHSPTLDPMGKLKIVYPLFPEDVPKLGLPD
eukprot:scaffold53_cov381-Pavlova_lutheri.AAC.15